MGGLGPLIGIYFLVYTGMNIIEMDASLMKSKMANVVCSQPNSVFYQFLNIKASFVKFAIKHVI